jgi:prepilin-type processing-associated H-X9-DG protein
MSCSNNLKQLALGCHNYESAYGYFPAGLPSCVDRQQSFPMPQAADGLPAGYFDANLPIWWVSGTQYSGGSRNRAQCYGPSWTLQLHSYIEQGALDALANIGIHGNPEEYAQANPPDNLDGGRPRYGSQGTTITKLWRCPSSGTQDVLFRGLRLEALRKGNYAANFGGGFFQDAAPGAQLAGAFGIVPIEKYPTGRRIGRGNTITDITDGSSNTLFISEVLTEDSATDSGNSQDWRGVWILAGIGANTFTAFTGPNSRTPDLIPACANLANMNTHPWVPCTLAWTNAWNSNSGSHGRTFAAARSKHTNGVNAAMGDGSVRFFTNSIDLNVWRALATKANGEPITNY